MSRRIALADQLYGGNVESTVLAPLCPNMVIWLKIPKLTWFKLCPSPKKMRHINIDLSMKSNHFSQEMVHEGPFFLILSNYQYLLLNLIEVEHVIC